MTQPEPDPRASLLAALAPDDLDEAFTIIDEGDAETVLAAWTIEDLDMASWAARHLARRREKVAEIDALADEQRFRIDRWAAEETARAKADAAFFESRLRGFHENALRTDPRAKTIRLPDGTELRSQAGKVSVVVEGKGEAFILWAEMNGVEGVVRLGDPEVDKTAVAKLYSAKVDADKSAGDFPALVGETGETVPGVFLRRAARNFTVSSDLPKKAS